ncbi:MAG TPA: hypothetical protein DIV40_00980 [Clostridiales bacterium]|jgi:hypothetical protein|nr:hypothetical protein [Clostridiales bacterium]
MAEKINLFISHYGGDEKHVEKINKLISNSYDVRDSSIVESEPNKATNKEYIKSLLRTQLDWAGRVIVLIGPKTHEREWVDWEIEYAGTHGDKRVIGVFLPGATDSDVPEMLNDYGDACIPWNEEKIIAALEGDNIWETSSGEKRPSVGNRGSC